MLQVCVPGRLRGPQARCTSARPEGPQLPSFRARSRKARAVRALQSPARSMAKTTLMKEGGMILLSSRERQRGESAVRERVGVSCGPSRRCHRRRCRTQWEKQTQLQACDHDPIFASHPGLHRDAWILRPSCAFLPGETNQDSQGLSVRCERGAQRKFRCRAVVRCPRLALKWYPAWRLFSYQNTSSRGPNKVRHTWTERQTHR